MKNSTKFVCQECGYSSPKWLGKCPGCSSWNTLVEEADIQPTKFSTVTSDEIPQPKKLTEITATNELRYTTHSAELNRVLGGGVVHGSLVLVGGDPGIGKSTLLLQICNSLGTYGTVFYVTGEESESQIKMRSDRLKINTDNLLLMS